MPEAPLLDQYAAYDSYVLARLDLTDDPEARAKLVANLAASREAQLWLKTDVGRIVMEGFEE